MGNLEDKVETEGKSVMDIKRENTIAVIKEAIGSGANSQSEIARRTGYSHTTVGNYGKEFRIELPKGKRGPPPKGYRVREDIDDLIPMGLTLEETGKKCKCTRENVRQYINKSGQYNKWTKARNDNTTAETRNRFGGKIQLSELHSLFLSTVRQRTETLAKEEGFATEKAIGYLHSYKRRDVNSYSFDTVHKLFKEYEDAVKGNEKISFETFGDKFGMWSRDVGRIFARIGLEPMFFAERERKVKVREKKEAVERGFGLDFSNYDICYFLGLPKHTINNRYMGKERKTGKRCIKYFGSNGLLTYKIASEVYEAQDCLFNQEEIMGLTGKNDEVVRYAIGHRKEIEPQIVSGLRVLYNDDSLTKPYVTSEMKERKLD